ncbi:DNA-primase RepB domain-containing protein [Phyllobacterium sp. 21LDTY02-6]|uniref:VapE domain-containing protein n=1 Tax=Phyllobacterium sp. 21LDTY02-6 TaxID=2944903 RepID=UPI0020209BA9|nr:VapE domain-containing protein [Phyllobacterium sp. 21LDTY02-6]MCO4317331.1 DNA-primase RepB domain-containing protein [Phyllobacterium sp. 21LDTY02-6]
MRTKLLTEKDPIDNTDENLAIEFALRFHPAHALHLVAMMPDRKLEAKTFPLDKLERARDWLKHRIKKANLYFHPNNVEIDVKDRKAKKAEIVSASTLHVDVDDASIESLERLRSYIPAPTVILGSGGGFHAYWRLTQPSFDLDLVEQANIQIAQTVGGDHCHNVDRIMRLPGTINLPNAKKLASGRVATLATVIESDWSRTYSLDDFPIGNEPSPAGSKISVVTSTDIAEVSIDSIGKTVSEATFAIIKQGDDPQKPRRGQNPRFRSRSEAVFRVACDLARDGLGEVEIAGILINPAYGISASILEKKNPKAYALKQARAAIAASEGGWPDVEKSGKPRPTMRNTIVALQRLELAFAHDLFRHRKIINGTQLEEHAGEISDDACSRLRGIVIDQFDFDPRADNVRDAVTQLCLENSLHPIRQMLDDLIWDGAPRVDGWLSVYLGAEDTKLNVAIGAAMLIAAVRRVREPGAKYDTIPILEGKQGTGKSTALQVLAGEGFHSDNEILTLDTKAQMEAMEGVWIYELSEISGLRKAEIERTKAFASRQVDRARMSYGRFSESRGRQAIFVGTTNDDKYLRDRTGNRRFLPVKTGQIDLNALVRDRDQLWAEAANREAVGESITLPSDLWKSAAAEQEERLEDDPWLEKLASIRGVAFGDEVRAFTYELLGITLHIELERQHNGHTKRLSGLMRSLGWEPGKFKVAGQTLRGFRRMKADDHINDPDFSGENRKF